jgi:hypothetical protein
MCNAPAADTETSTEEEHGTIDAGPRKDEDATTEDEATPTQASHIIK